jgi:hypothetical protein
MTAVNARRDPNHQRVRHCVRTYRHALLAIAALLLGEVVSEPVGPRNEPVPVAAPAVAMARDRDGVAIAWAGVNRMYTARLDANGRVAGAVHEIAGDAAGCPSIAVSPRGSGFTLAWMEDSRAMFCRLDGTLAASSPRLLIDSTNAPVLVRSGASTWLAAGLHVWELHDDGTLDPSVESGLVGSDMSASARFPRLAGAKKFERSFGRCSSMPGCSIHGPLGGVCVDRPGATSSFSGARR